MRSLPFRLTCFQATCAVGGNWKDFIASQPGLYELYLDGDFCGVVPDSTVLPNPKARPTDIARFVETHGLCDAWFFTGAPLGTKTLSAVELTHFDNAQYCLTTLRISAPDFLLLSVAAPEFVELLCHLVLDEDLTWSDFTLDSGADCVVRGILHSCRSLILINSFQAGSTFGQVATALDGQFIHLKSVLLVCARPTQGRGQRRPLLVSDAECFSKVFASHSKSPSVRAFCFYAQDGVVYWNGWGQPEEEKSYSTHWRLLDPEYSPLF
jgi:antitoxin component HigA of HigAB toxin-antitoxin module